MNLRTPLLVLALAGATRLAAQSGTPLPRSTPEAQGISSAGILSFLQAADSGVDAMHSVMIAEACGSSCHFGRPGFPTGPAMKTAISFT